MASALPPVTDCGCSSSSLSSSDQSPCCDIFGVGNPNDLGVVPDDATTWSNYVQLADLTAGPPIQTWYWNPNLQLWQ